MSHRPAAAAALIFLGLLLAPSAAAQPAIAESEVRALAARQAQALNAGELSAYFATFAPQARFTQQALGSDNRIVPYGTSTLAQARAQLARATAASRITETVQVRNVAVAANGRGAAMAAQVRTRIEGAVRTRTSCAERLTTFARVGGALKALSQTDTLVRCRAAP